MNNTHTTEIKLNQYTSLIALVLLSPLLLIWGILQIFKSNFMRAVIKNLLPIYIIVFLCFFGGYKYGAEQIDMISIVVVAVVCYVLGIWVAKN